MKERPVRRGRQANQFAVAPGRGGWASNRAVAETVSAIMPGRLAGWPAPCEDLWTTEPQVRPQKAAALLAQAETSIEIKLCSSVDRPAALALTPCPLWPLMCMTAGRPACCRIENPHSSRNLHIEENASTGRPGEGWTASGWAVSDAVSGVHQLRIGSMVEYPGAPGIGRVSEIDGAKVKIDYFESVAEPVAESRRVAVRGLPSRETARPDACLLAGPRHRRLAGWADRRWRSGRVLRAIP